MCAAPKNTIKLARSMPAVIQCCPKSPAVGGKHKESSKYCSEHSFVPSISPKSKQESTGENNALNNTNSEESVPGELKSRFVVTINLKEFSCVSKEVIESSRDLPANDDPSVHVACKKKENLNRFYDRTAGILAMVRPCGIILDVQEMYTCESPSQVFVWILRICSQDWEQFKYVGYDRACEFEPFLNNLQKKGNIGATELLQHLCFFVDIYHCLRHVKKTCMPLEDNPLCRYHPKLERFKDIWDVNTEAAEQTWVWFNGYRHNVRKMTQFKFKFFLWILSTKRNEYTVKRLKRKNMM